MTIREQLELRELEYLSSYAALSKDSKGRKRKEEPCDIRPAFQRSLVIMRLDIFNPQA